MMEEAQEICLPAGSPHDYKVQGKAHDARHVTRKSWTLGSLSDLFAVPPSAYRNSRAWALCYLFLDGDLDLNLNHRHGV